MKMYYGNINSYHVFIKDEETKIFFSGLISNLQSWNPVFVQEPWLFQKRQEGMSQEGFLTAEHHVCALETRIGNRLLNIYSYQQYFLVKFVLNPIEGFDSDLKTILNSIESISKITAVGFELSLFIDEYPECIIQMLNDESLFPIYIRSERVNNGVYNRLSHTDSEMCQMLESYIESIKADPDFEDVENTDLILKLNSVL